MNMVKYNRKLNDAAAKIDPADFQRMVKIANRVWQYIGSDFMDGSDEFDNEAAIECCFDANRPLTCHNTISGDEAKADEQFMQTMYPKYGWAVIVSAVGKQVRFI